MEQKFSSLDRVMEPETISKNGASLKSYMSKVESTIPYFILSCIFCFFSCSSPESDGIKAAKKLCDCVDESHENIRQAHESYIKNFNSYSFRTRIEAREKLSDVLQKVYGDDSECRQKAYAYREELESKYKTNKENAEKFKYAFDSHTNSFRPKEPVYEDYARDRINSLIFTIIPPKPNLEKLKNDLLISRGYDIYKKDSYYNDYSGTKQQIIWMSTIQPEYLKEVKILSATNNDDKYLLLVYLHIYRGANYVYSVDENVIVTYSIGGSDDWYIEKIETEK